MTSPAGTSEEALRVTRRWIEKVVVGLELCPFARREVERGAIRYVVSEAVTEAVLLEELAAELCFLRDDPGTETTLLIHPQVLDDFFAYNEFLGDCDALLEAQGMAGEFQIASFHPAYLFAGADPADAANYTNRSPHPMLHLLREASVSRAVDGHPAIEEVPRRNVALLQRLGAGHLRSLMMEDR